MPSGPYLYADDLIDALKRKHASGTYKRLVSRFCQFASSFFSFNFLSVAGNCWGSEIFYVNLVDAVRLLLYPLNDLQVFYIEACESGSIFEGLLPEGLNICATTASNAEEDSWGTYCPGDYPGPPPEYQTCLGDLYAVSWMEDRYSQAFRCSFHPPFRFSSLFFSLLVCEQVTCQCEWHVCVFYGLMM